MDAFERIEAADAQGTEVMDIDEDEPFLPEEVNSD